MVQQPMPNPTDDREAWREWVRRQPGVTVLKNPQQKPWTPPTDVCVIVHDINELTGDDWDDEDLAGL